MKLREGITYHSVISSEYNKRDSNLWHYQRTGLEILGRTLKDSRTSNHAPWNGTMLLHHPSAPSSTIPRGDDDDVHINQGQPTAGIGTHEQE